VFSRSFGHSSKELDLNRTPSEAPLWSETRWCCCWSPESGAGIYIHAGRFRKDRSLWWVHVAALLPDRRVAVDRIWTPNRADAGVRSDALELAMTEDGWRSTFDGAGELTDISALASGTRGDGAPSVRVRWEVTATGAAPLWDMYRSIDREQTFASELHIQQRFTTTGTLTVDGERYALDGVGFKDHSCGARDWTSWHSHRFMIGAMPDWTVHAVTIGSPTGAPMDPFGVVMTDQGERPVEEFEAPALARANGAPTAWETTVTGPAGPVTLQTELVHGLPITISEDNDNLNGIAWDLASNPIAMVEGFVRLTDPSGNVGYGFFERSARCAALPPPADADRQHPAPDPEEI